MTTAESDVEASEIVCTAPKEGYSMQLVRKWEELNAQVVTVYQQGWYSGAATLGEDTLVLAMEIFGPNHLNTAESLRNLALIYFAQARDTEAAIFEQTLATKDDRASLLDSLDMSKSLNKAVLFNLVTNQYSRAESLLNRALEIRKKALGQDHPDFLENVGNLAALYNAQGRHDEAQSLLRSIRSQDAIASIRTAIAETEESSRGFIEGYENRFFSQLVGESLIDFQRKVA